MKTRIAAAALLATLTSALPPAAAASFQFRAESLRGNGGGVLVPDLRVSVNSMNAARGVEQAMDTDERLRPVVSAVNENNNTYSLIVGLKDAATGQAMRILPPGPCRTRECMDRNYINFAATAADGTPILVRATIASPDGRLDPGSIYGFNPQPEPPGDFPSPVRVDFALSSANATSSISVTWTVVVGARELALE